MRAWRKTSAALGVLALIAAGCGRDSGTTTVNDDGDGAQTVKVSVDHTTKDFPTSSFAYYPSKVTLHPGDTIDFVGSFTGTEHTVSSGTLLDKANKIQEELGDEGEPNADQQKVLDQVPLTFDEEVTPQQFDDGANVFVQAGMQPCFADKAEEITTREACPNPDQPASFTGKDLIYSSGFVEDQQVFSVTLDDALPLGEYLFFCLVHGPEMSTEVTVVEPSARADTAEAAATRASKEIDAALEQVREFAEQTLAITDPAKALAGPPPELYEQEDSGPMDPNVFPREIGIKAGESVTWTFTGFHVIAFNAPESARPAFGFQDDGDFGVNPRSRQSGGAPSMVTLEPPGGGEGGGEEDGPPPYVPVDAGTFDGSGFFSSGFPPFSDGVAQWTLAFSTPGTWKYICLVHPDMEGVVNVS